MTIDLDDPIALMLAGAAALEPDHVSGRAAVVIDSGDVRRDSRISKCRQLSAYELANGRWCF